MCMTNIFDEPLLVTSYTRGIGTAPADPAAAGLMFESAFVIQLKTLPAIFR